MATVSKGRCYLCGKELGKTAMKNHILKAHGVEEGGQECQLLKIEGAGKNYCAVCGKDAAYICSECMWERDNPFFCEACAEDHEHAEMLFIRITASSLVISRTNTGSLSRPNLRAAARRR